LNVHKTIHRDLKPENILISANDVFDRVRVMDYGLARCFVTQDEIEEAQQATANVGSGGYQAPETITARYQRWANYGPSCDVWSLGVVLYIVMRGSPPFGLGDRARINDIKTGKYAPMTGPKWAKVPDEIKEIIKKMLVVDPTKRMTMDDVLSDPYICNLAGADPMDGVANTLDADLQRVASESSM